MIGTRTRNALARRLLKVKSAKSLAKWLDVLKKKDIQAEELRDIWAAAIKQGHIALVEKLANTIVDEKFILHQNCLVSSESLLRLVDKIASKDISAKEAQKVFKNIHCAVLDKLVF